MNLKCKTCGKLVRAKPSRIKSGQKFCGRKCQYSKSIPERFWEKVEKGPSCWEWRGALGSGNYGSFQVGARKSARAHRFSYEITRGKIPMGLVVRHKCDNPKCVRPDHLEVGSHQQNSDDREIRGRTARGFKIPRTKLSPSNVADIKERYATGKFTYARLGELFSISERYAWDIVNNVYRTKGADVYYQQGDVILIKVGVIPKDAVPVKDFDGVLQHGEATGHYHKLMGGGATFYSRPNGERHLRLLKINPLEHQEHEVIEIEPGEYEVRIVREVGWFDDMVNPVVD